MISSPVGANYCTVSRADEAVALRLEELENGCGHRGRGFLRQIMPDDRNRPALIASGEKARLAGGRFRSVDAIALALQHDRRHPDRRLRSEQPFKRLQCGIARRVAETVAVGVDDDIDKIRIVE